MTIFVNNILLVLTFFIGGCAMFDSRDFEDQMEPRFTDEPFFMANRDFDIVAGDDGRQFRSSREILSRTPASRSQVIDNAYQNSISRELINLENSMEDREYATYLNVKDKLANDSERIYYIDLGNDRERKNYLVSKGLLSEKESTYTTALGTEYNKMDGRRENVDLRTESIALGMGKEVVISNWGEPWRKDIAGKAEYENERWAYKREGKIKYIYFEKGRVEGWTEQETQY